MHGRQGRPDPSLDQAEIGRTRPQGYAGTSRTPFMPHVVGAGQPGPGEVRPPANNNTWPHARAPHEPRTTAEPSLSAFEPSIATRHENVVMHPSVAGGRGMAGSSTERDAMMPQPPRPQGLDLGAPSATSAAAAMAATRPQEATVIAAAPVVSPAEPTVTVAATRETVTYTLPVSEARLPPSLLGRVQTTAQAATATAPIQIEAMDAPMIVTPARALPPPLRPIATVLESDVVAMPATAAPASSTAGSNVQAEANLPVMQSVQPDMAGDEVRSMALRFGPAAREG